MVTPYAIFLSLILICKSDDTFNYVNNGSDWEGRCNDGEIQSPIDIDLTNTSLISGNTYSINLDYESLATTASFTGPDYIVNGSFGYARFETPGGVLIGNAIRVVVKAPSEHTINSRHFDLELQVIHRVENTERNAILSVLFEKANIDSEIIDDIQKAGDGEAEIDLLKLFGDRLYLENYYSYLGSITEPPCTENVTWFIWASVQPVSRSQLLFFTNQWAKNMEFADGSGNNRAINDIGDRVVLEFFGVDY